LRVVENFMEQDKDFILADKYWRIGIGIGLIFWGLLAFLIGRKTVVEKITTIYESCATSTTTFTLPANLEPGLYDVNIKLERK